MQSVNFQSGKGPWENAQWLQKSRSIGNGDVFSGIWAGEKCIFKTYSKRPWFIRVFLGRYCLRKEHRMLQILREKNIMATPRILGWLDKNTLVTQYMENEGHLESPLHHPELQQPPLAFFQKLRDAYQALHQAGIAHGDVRRTNILIAPDKTPVVIDWSTGVFCGENPSFLTRIIFRILRRCDQYALAKILQDHAPELMTPELAHCLQCPPWYLRLGQFWRQKIYKRFLRSKSKNGQPAPKGK